MALKLIKTKTSIYDEIQKNGTWENKAIYIVSKSNGSAELYIEGESCGSFYDDTSIINKIIQIENELDNFIPVTNVEIDTIMNS